MFSKAYIDKGHHAARRLYPGPLFCERPECGEPAERHHRDGDPQNNVRSNLRFLCRKHHHEEDGRCQRAEYRARNSAARKGRQNERSLQNLKVQQVRGASKSDEHKQAMSLAMRGRPKTKWSPERRAAFSEMKRNWYEKRRAVNGVV